MLAESVDAANAGEFRGVVQFGHVRGIAGEEGFFEQFDDGALEGDDMTLELGLGDYCAWSVSIYGLVSRGMAKVVTYNLPRRSEDPWWRIVGHIPA